MTIDKSFDDPWPEVLDNMKEWITNQVLTSVGATTRIKITISGSLLLVAKREGKGLAHHFKRFRNTLEKRFAGRIDFAGDETAKTHRIAIILEEPR